MGCSLGLFGLGLWELGGEVDELRRSGKGESGMVFNGENEEECGESDEKEQDQASEDFYEGFGEAFEQWAILG